MCILQSQLRVQTDTPLVMCSGSEMKCASSGWQTPGRAAIIYWASPSSGSPEGNLLLVGLALWVLTAHGGLPAHSHQYGKGGGVLGSVRQQSMAKKKKCLVTVRILARFPLNHISVLVNAAAAAVACCFSYFHQPPGAVVMGLESQPCHIMD